MKSGKYKVIRGFHVYNCTFGQLKMDTGVTFEVMENGWTARAGDVLFPTELLNGCERNVVKIGR